VRFTKENIETHRLLIKENEGLYVWSCDLANEALDEIERLQARVQELEQERRWIPVRDYPSQVGWYRVITNNGTEQIREYVREPDRDIHYWDVKDGEWIMMYTNPPLPQPPQEGE